MTEQNNDKPVLLTMKGLRIEGRADETWSEIVHGIDLTLHKGEVLGLIGESGAGKSTVGLAAMGFTRDGCRISGGSVVFDGVELVDASSDTPNRKSVFIISGICIASEYRYAPEQRIVFHSERI